MTALTKKTPSGWESGREGGSSLSGEYKPTTVESPQTRAHLEHPSIVDTGPGLSMHQISSYWTTRPRLIYISGKGLERLSSPGLAH